MSIKNLTIKRFMSMLVVFAMLAGVFPANVALAYTGDSEISDFDYITFGTEDSNDDYDVDLTWDIDIDEDDDDVTAVLYISENDGDDFEVQDSENVDSNDEEVSFQIDNLDEEEENVAFLMLLEDDSYSSSYDPDDYDDDDIYDVSNEEDIDSDGSTSSNGGKPTVDTVTATLVGGSKMEATGKIVKDGNSDIDEVGFVFDYSDSTPTMDDPDGDFEATYKTDFSGTFTIDDDKDKVYVAAYAVNDEGTSYGDTIIVDLGEVPTAKTVSVTNVSKTSADVKIDITDDGDSSVKERGVVYSKTDSTPIYSESGVNYKSVSGTTGDATVAITGLEENKKYYTRAYAKNGQGYGYGEVKEFTTGNAVVTTQNVTNVSGTTATATGSIESIDKAVIEKGFVYSTSNTSPTKSDTVVSSSTAINTKGSYTLPISALKAETKYYLRAYAVTSDNTSYGNVVEFTTTTSKPEITITYKTLNNVSVSTQKIPAVEGATLDTGDLNVPDGYALYDPNWTYKVSKPTNITLAVVPAGEEKEFMAGIGNNLFAPNRPATRGEVAQVLYNLSSDKSISTPITFTDVPADSAYKTAIDFATANKYMVGYPDGSFKPNGTITRAEICVVLTTYFHLQGPATSSFPDVPNTSWSYPYVSYAFNNGIIVGYEDGTFRPQTTITRAEIAKVFCDGADRSLKPLGTEEFDDVTSDKWYYKYVMNASIPK